MLATATGLSLHSAKELVAAGLAAVEVTVEDPARHTPRGGDGNDCGAAK